MNELNELQDQAYENSLIYKEKTKKINDFKIKNHVFNVGDRVSQESSKPDGPDRSSLLKFSLMEPSSYLKPTNQISSLDPFIEIPSGESKVHIEVLSVLWGNMLPIPDGSLPLSRTPDVATLKKVEDLLVEIRLLDHGRLAYRCGSCIRYIKKDKNKAKTDKTEHEIGRVHAGDPKERDWLLRRVEIQGLKWEDFDSRVEIKGLKTLIGLEASFSCYK
ncbi:hypothetical protein Tco_0941645 [Tanacetum coccineum]|uniref:Uncharacterized protein n=1 Tax=Tanacetum coccineum TaxID=301880 RepID=A0ABQ5DRI1_9ASTR